MELITNNSRFVEIFKDLAESHDAYYWAVGWASRHSVHSETLAKFPEKASCLVFGLFDHHGRPTTHPDFVDEMFGKQGIHFVVRKNRGVFHPKIYLFWTEKDRWDCLIGSHNYTEFAFKENDEASVHITSGDCDASFASKVRNQIESYLRTKSLEIESEIDYPKNYRLEWDKAQSTWKEMGKRSKDDEVAQVTDNSRLEIACTYWIDLSTIQTWQEHFSAGNLRQRRCHFKRKFGLTGKHMLQRGDMLIHYITKPAKVFVGASIIINDEFQDGRDNPHHNPTFRWYLDIEPVLEIHDTDRAVRLAEIKRRLSFRSGPPGVNLMGGHAWKREDALAVIQALKEKIASN